MPANDPAVFPSPALSETTLATATPPQTPSNKPATSFSVFRSFIFPVPDPANPGFYKLDASQVVSKQCYSTWLESRGDSVPNEPEKTFQRILTAHVTSSDGRQPFTAEEEAAILAVLRVKGVWPAFIGTGYTIGSKGFRSYGFHEKALHSMPVTEQVHRSKKRSRASAEGAAAAAAAAAAAPRSGFLVHLPPPHQVGPNQQSSLESRQQGPAVSFEPASGLSLDDHQPQHRPLHTRPEMWPANLLLEDLPEDPRVLAGTSRLFFDFLRALADVSSSAPPSDPTLTPKAEPGSNKQALITRALAAMSRLSKADTAMLAVNLHATNFDEVFLAQNARSVHILGAVACNTSGAYRSLVPESRLAMLARHVRFCTANPRTPVVLSCRVFLLSGEALLRIECEYDGDGIMVFATTV